MVNSCTVCLNNTRKRNDISYFSYPTDDIRRERWLVAVGREDLRYKLLTDKARKCYRICEEHFESNCIKYSKNRTMKYLTEDAFPKVNLPVNGKQEEFAAPFYGVANTSQRKPIPNKNQIDTMSMNNESQFEIITPKQENVIDSMSNNGATTSQCDNILIPKEEIDFFEISEVETGRSLNVTEIKIERVETPPNDDDTSNCDTNLTQESDDVPSQSGTARKRKLSSDREEEVKKTKSSILESVTNEDFLELCQKFMSKEMYQLIKGQIDLQADSSENRYSGACNFFALSLLYSNSAAYEFLRNTLSLPSPTSLRNFVKPTGTQVDERLLSILKFKVDGMGPHEKICSVCVDSMCIKTNLYYDVTHDRIIGFQEINGTQKVELLARYVFVIMIRGIVHQWVQPIGYGFLSEWKYNPDLNDWIDKIITSLINIGLDVRSFVSDLDLEMVTACKSRAVSIQKRHFENNGRKIYKIFDVPHLIKCVKNKLKTCDYVYDDKIIKWSYVKEVCKNDITNEIKLPAQDLSNTIATSIRCHVDSNLIDPTARDTADFIEKINKLDDILNSTKSKSLNTFKKPFCGEKYQLDFLHNMLDFFQRLKVLETGKDITEITNFIVPFQITIKSILDLYEDLRSEGIECLYTKRLSKNVIDNFFKKTVKESGDGKELTCRQIDVAFRKMFTTNILKKPVHTNSEEDLSSLLMKQEQFDTYSHSHSVEITPITIDTTDYHFDLPAKNALFFVSAYLYRKCIEYHKRENLEAHDGNIKYGGLVTTPPEYFIKFIDTLEKKFCEYFNRKEISANIANCMLQHIQDCTLQTPCECFPVEYLKKLYVRFRIYHTIKRNNKFISTRKIKAFRINNL